MQALDSTFAALADPTRRAILARLADGEACVNDFVGAFGLTQPGITKHVQTLERAGLVVRRKDRQRRPIRLRPEALTEAANWIDFYRRFFDGTLDRLEAHLKSAPPNAEESPR
jgi:DNA-binding transcriptional ArsR family regulator